MKICSRKRLRNRILSSRTQHFESRQLQKLWPSQPNLFTHTVLRTDPPPALYIRTTCKRAPQPKCCAGISQTWEDLEKKSLEMFQADFYMNKSITVCVGYHNWVIMKLIHTECWSMTSYTSLSCTIYILIKCWHWFCSSVCCIDVDGNA